ncbi:MAG: DNA alkylation repair protein [Thermoplasmata archaeon]
MTGSTSRAALSRRVRALRQRLVTSAVPSRFDLRAYLSSPLPVLGVRAGELAAIAREVLRGPPSPGRRDIERLASLLWRGTTYEERALAIVLLDRQPHLLADSTWRLMDRWVRRATGWGLCDALAGGPIARMVATDPSRLPEILRWARSPDIWRRRASLYSLHHLVRRGRLTEPLRVIDVLVEDPEFWVQRAVGTWLRECGKRDEARIRTYLRRNAARLPPVALTVATERVPAALRAQLRAIARRARQERSGHRKGTPRRSRPAHP